MSLQSIFEAKLRTILESIFEAKLRTIVKSISEAKLRTIDAILIPPVLIILCPFTVTVEPAIKMKTFYMNKVYHRSEWKGHSVLSLRGGEAARRQAARRGSARWRSGEVGGKK